MVMNENGNYDSINLDRFILKPAYFDHQSDLHGINHTYRVMYHCLALGEALKLISEAKLAFMAAFIHDMARIHDGYCTVHGALAAEHKLPLFSNLFEEAGAGKDDIGLICTAVLNHSLPSELACENPAAIITAILKDADALDRIRLGEDNLKTEYLRFSESLALIETANRLFYVCPCNGLNSFGELITLIRELEK
jgi:HD superfamily phosphodiesterase